jgi:hypothetical protein
MNIKIRGKPPWDARGTPCLGTPCIKLRDGPIVRVRGKPPFIEFIITYLRDFNNLVIEDKLQLLDCRSVLIRCRPICWLHRRCRVLAAKQEFTCLGFLS